MCGSRYFMVCFVVFVFATDWLFGEDDGRRRPQFNGPTSGQ